MPYKTRHLSTKLAYVKSEKLMSGFLGVLRGALDSLKRILGTPAENGWMVLNAFRWWVMSFVSLMHLLVLLLFLRNGEYWNQSDNWRFQFLLLLVVSLLLALFFLVMRRTKATEIFLGVQAFVLFIAAYPQGGDIGLISLFTVIMVTELSLWPAREATLVVVASNLFFAALCFHPLPAFGHRVPSPTPFEIATMFMAASLFQLICFSARHYVIKTGLQSQEIGNLNTSLGNLLKANLHFQNYAVEVGEQSTIEECKRLTREIHDGVGYTMINLKMMLEAATDLSGEENERLRTLLEQAKNEVQNGLTETRHALRLFRELDNVKIEGIRYIHKLTSSFSHATGIPVEVNYGNIPWSFGEDINAVIYRILQESMTNAIRHGHATRIQISFWICDGRLLISVDDNGVGSGEIKPGIGFMGMKERLEPLGGELTLSNGVNGFTVRVEIPWPGE